MCHQPARKVLGNLTKHTNKIYSRYTGALHYTHLSHSLIKLGIISQQLQQHNNVLTKLARWLNNLWIKSIQRHKLRSTLVISIHVI